MNENEFIARWLEWAQVGEANRRRWWYQGNFYRELPNFRTSNEWAGAVLGKLGSIYPGIAIDGRESRWFVTPGEEGNVYADWRYAVIDAALEVIRRESGATAGKP